ncbi:hypothetical protein P879_09216 [Paragonimus westermani]|uniref:Bromo domain-containing protein n=1 Tax=Paragonimus westermani TaxID=34504 RepID=A0A8T0D5A3_9TREM|nr:hypothetical protein P879_09216 [Paragonimus westermani]
MSSDDGHSSSLPCVTQSSTNLLKLKISFSGNKVQGHSDVAGNEVNSESVITEVTSRNLYLVLTELHNQLVRRDPRRIFANPVTDDIAAGYSETISHPMDLGTISNRLISRACYKSVTDYLADVTLMCNNAMVYNPPDTIYYQRARKLQSFCRKQFTVSFLKKLCNQLGLKAGLTNAEIGESFLNEEQQRNQFDSAGSRRSRSCDNGLRSSSRLTPSSVDSPGKDWYLVTSSDSVTGSRLTMARSAVVGESGRVEPTDTNRHPLTTSTPDTSSKFSVKSSIQTQVIGFLRYVFAAKLTHVFCMTSVLTYY